MKIVQQKQIEIYVTKDGRKPFLDWLESLNDREFRCRIKTRLDRVALGNLGDYKYLSDGIYELRTNFGPGYRIYYGTENDRMILLLEGGDKSTQKKDIKKAIAYWKDYLSR